MVTSSSIRGVIVLRSKFDLEKLTLGLIRGNFGISSNWSLKLPSSDSFSILPYPAFEIPGVRETLLERVIIEMESIETFSVWLKSILKRMGEFSFYFRQLCPKTGHFRA